jgi:hypothetical protein
MAKRRRIGVEAPVSTHVRRLLDDVNDQEVGGAHAVEVDRRFVAVEDGDVQAGRVAEQERDPADDLSPVPLGEPRRTPQPIGQVTPGRVEDAVQRDGCEMRRCRRLNG